MRQSFFPKNLLSLKFVVNKIFENRYPKMYIEFLSSIIIYFFLNGIFKTVTFNIEINNKKPSEITNENPKYDSVIYILFDALRYDYTLPNLTASPHYLHNHMQNFYNFPYKFDALSVCGIPTSTTCRVTGLLTGTPSNFLEGIKTFMNEKLDIDNMVDQMYKRYNGSLSFFGDKTWLDLCPILKECPNLTIDPYSKKNLEKNELLAMAGFINRIGKDKAILGHFISLDGFGHLYDTNHFELKNSLIRFDNFIKEVYDKMGENTLLVLTSDHGVNDDGEHGGCSSHEMSSFVSFISKKPIDIKPLDENIVNLRNEYISRKYDTKNIIYANRPDTSKSNIIHQDDILPTVCYLLDVPVPKNSYGNFIHELINNENFLDWFYDQKLEMINKKRYVKDLILSHYKLTIDICNTYSGTNNLYLFLSSIVFIALASFIIYKYKKFLSVNSVLLLFSIIMVSHSIRALKVEKYFWIFVFLVNNFKPVNILGMLIYYLHDQNDKSNIFFFCIGFLIFYSIYTDLEISKKKKTKKINLNIFVQIILSSIRYFYPEYIDNREFLGVNSFILNLSLMVFPPKFNMFLTILPLLEYKRSVFSSFPLLYILSGSKQIEKIDYSVPYVFTDTPSPLYSGIPALFYFVYPRFVVKKDKDFLLYNLLSLLIVYGVTYWEFDTMMFYHFFADRCFFMSLFFVIDMVLNKIE